MLFTNWPWCQCRHMYSKLDLDKSYSGFFELMWYSQIPCYDILGITTQGHQNHGKKFWTKNFVLFIEIGHLGMIKKCLWRGKPVSCAAIFKMQPTDRGMCCSFNKETADKMFRESRYREHVMRMNMQDETMSKEDSKLPEWLASLFYLFCDDTKNHH